jgi:hypothetical protein
MADGDRRSALGAVLDLLGEFFDLLGFFHDGEGKRGCCVRLIDLVFELGDHFVEFCYVRPNLFLVLPIDGLLIGAGSLRAVETRGEIGIGSVRGGTRLRFRSNPWGLKRCNQGPSG